MVRHLALNRVDSSSTDRLRAIRRALQTGNQRQQRSHRKRQRRRGVGEPAAVLPAKGGGGGGGEGEGWAPGVAAA